MSVYLNDKLCNSDSVTLYLYKYFLSSVGSKQLIQCKHLLSLFFFFTFSFVLYSVVLECGEGDCLSRIPIPMAKKKKNGHLSSSAPTGLVRMKGGRSTSSTCLLFSLFLLFLLTTVFRQPSKYHDLTKIWVVVILNLLHTLMFFWSMTEHVKYSTDSFQSHKMVDDFFSVFESLLKEVYVNPF